MTRPAISCAAKGGRCVDCGACKSACPQSIAIRADPKRAQSTLDAV